MLYDHKDASFLMRHARGLIDLAGKASGQRERDALLTEASHVITSAERLVHSMGRKPVVIMAEAAE